MQNTARASKRTKPGVKACVSPALSTSPAPVPAQLLEGIWEAWNRMQSSNPGSATYMLGETQFPHRQKLERIQPSSQGHEHEMRTSTSGSLLVGEAPLILVSAHLSLWLDGLNTLLASCPGRGNCWPQRARPPDSNASERCGVPPRTFPIPLPLLHPGKLLAAAACLPEDGVEVGNGFALEITLVWGLRMEQSSVGWVGGGNERRVAPQTLLIP